MPELLENILSNLSVRQLFGVQRTSKVFIGTINGSVKLQRKMFLKKDTSISSKSDAPMLNPLLDELFFVPSRELTSGPTNGIKFKCQEHEDQSDKKENTSDQDLDLVFQARKRPQDGKIWTKIHRYHRVKKNGKAGKLYEVDQSWRRTVVSQGVPKPLDTGLDVEEIERHGEPIGLTCWDLDDEDNWNGVTLGKIIDDLENTLSSEIREIELEEREWEEEPDLQLF